MSDKTTPFINKEVMMERGRFTANGYTFAVRPVYLGEEDEYFNDFALSPVPADEEEHTDKELGQYAMALFSNPANRLVQQEKERFSFVGLINRLYNRLFRPKDYRYYDASPAVQPLIKWLERKVTYKGRKIRFYDLERKYGLNKSEIQKLIAYFHELSGF